MDACDSTTILQSRRLDASAVTVGTLQIPAELGTIIEVDGADVILSDREQRAFARVNVGTDGSLSVLGFATAAGSVSNPRWENGRLRGVALGQRVLLSL